MEGEELGGGGGGVKGRGDETGLLPRVKALK